jgi:exopolyphosphatase/guanosine-5'-triphosphate,3'-diphosphate pyrophosphatase
LGFRPIAPGSSSEGVVTLLPPDRLSTVTGLRHAGRMKLAALDLGSNSFHLLVAETDTAGELTKVGSHKDVLRLGSVVQECGHLDGRAFGSALASVGRMAAVARELGAKKVMAVATSALRDARNGRAFCDACTARYGVDIELLSGDDEARLAYLGARSALRLTQGRVLVADVGGGSVELAAGNGASCDSVQSLQLGFLRLARAFPLGEPGGALRLSRYVQFECEKARWQLGRIDTLLLSGGTARAMGKLLGGGIASASTSQVLKLCESLSEASVSGLIKRGVERRRATTLAAGAAVVAGLVAGFGLRELRISPRGLREGVLLRELAARAATVAA